MPIHDTEELVPTPTIFDHRDVVNLRLRGVVTDFPVENPSSRWMQAGREVLPHDDPYVEVLFNQGIENFPLPALLHSRETLVYLGLDAAFAEECWDKWVHMRPEQRTVPATKKDGYPPFLSNIAMLMNNRSMSQEPFPTLPEEEMENQVYPEPEESQQQLEQELQRLIDENGGVYDPAFVDMAGLTVSEATNRQIRCRIHEAKMLRFFGLSPEAVWYFVHATHDIRTQEMLGLFKLDLDNFKGRRYVFLLQKTLLEPRYRLLLKVKRMSEVRAGLWERFAPLAPIPGDEDDTVYDGEALLAETPRCVDPNWSSASTAEDPAVLLDRRIRCAMGMLQGQHYASTGIHLESWTFDMPQICRYSKVPSTFVCQPILDFIEKTKFKKKLETYEKVKGQEEPKIQSPHKFLVEMKWEGIPVGDVWDVAHNPYPYNP
ncbi:hypothetical protein UCDDS831_g05863 [Diplodia seriata]|uniref:Uncharacterized protein n=1 Tax=Diplodia seriata TaxID=420778 RepID=A0A0G2G433_9PEZI|nr:hypothetical protein UCDDS831_g05863 [Diplodia seriata]